MEEIQTAQNKTDPHDQVLEIIFDKDDITWQSMLYELVRTEQMDPWDIDITQLAQKFFDTVQTMREMDFRISGKK